MSPSGARLRLIETSPDRAVTRLHQIVRQRVTRHLALHFLARLDLAQGHRRTGGQSGGQPEEQEYAEGDLDRAADLFTQVSPQDEAYTRLRAAAAHARAGAPAAAG